MLAAAIVVWIALVLVMMHRTVGIV